MEAMLESTNGHGSPKELRQILANFAVGMGQFEYQILPHVVQRLLHEGGALPEDERRELAAAFSSESG